MAREWDATALLPAFAGKVDLHNGKEESTFLQTFYEMLLNDPAIGGSDHDVYVKEWTRLYQEALKNILPKI